LSADQFPQIIREFASGISPIHLDVDLVSAVLDDLGEISSDLGILFVPETIILRLGTLVGKLLELTSDYLPDRALRGDELVFNIPIMLTSMFLLGRSAVPILKAQFVELDNRDECVYEMCFRPVGVKLLQFKCMKATGCFEWITYEAGTVLIDEEEEACPSEEYCAVDDKQCNSAWKYLYWQLDGAVIRSFQGNSFGFIERTEGKHIDDPDAQGLLGDTRFLVNLEHEARRQQKTGNDVKNDDCRNYSRHPIATITVGPQGARLLRIDSLKLFDLMQDDEKLESSIRLLLLKSLKLKIGNLLSAKRQETESTIDYVMLSHGGIQQADASSQARK
jgi:hypothetical protein